MRFYFIADVWSTDNLDVKDARVFETERDIKSAYDNGYDKWELRWLVDDIAEFYYDNHDGYEIADRWQSDGIVFALWDSEKNLIGKYNVSLEYQPTFSAWEV